MHGLEANAKTGAAVIRSVVACALSGTKAKAKTTVKTV